jgi:hypothetical protein
MSQGILTMTSRWGDEVITFAPALVGEPELSGPNLSCIPSQVQAPSARNQVRECGHRNFTGQFQTGALVLYALKVIPAREAKMESVTVYLCRTKSNQR